MVERQKASSKLRWVWAQPGAGTAPTVEVEAAPPAGEPGAVPAARPFLSVATQEPRKNLSGLLAGYELFLARRPEPAAAAPRLVPCGRTHRAPPRGVASG